MQAKKICALAILLLFIFSVPLTAQPVRSSSGGIVIKDTVSIAPQAISGKSPVDVVNSTVTFKFTWQPEADPGFHFIIDVYHCKGMSRAGTPFPAGEMTLTLDNMGYSSYTFYSQHATPKTVKITDGDLPPVEITFGHNASYSPPYRSAFRFNSSAPGEIPFHGTGLLQGEVVARCGDLTRFFCDQPATFTIEKGAEYAYLINPKTGEPAGASYSANGLCSGVINLAIADNRTAVKPEEVVVSVTQAGETFGTKTFRLHSFDRFDVSPDREAIEHGEAVSVIATATDEEGNEVSIPQDTRVRISCSPSGFGRLVTELAERITPEGPVQDSLIKATAKLKNSQRELHDKEQAVNTLSAVGVTGKSEEGGKSAVTDEEATPSELETDYASVNNGSVVYYADGETIQQDTTITFTVTIVDNPGKTGTGTLVLQPRNCPKVVLSRKQINPGDTVDVTVKRKFDDGTERDYPAGTLFFMYIAEGADYGNLLAGDQLSSSIYNVEMPVKFVAAASIDADSAIVVLKGEDGIVSRIAPGKDTIMEPTMSLNMSVKQQGSAGKKGLHSRVSSVNEWQAVNEFECGEPADTVVIKGNAHKILLGETMYYQATKDPNHEDKIILKEFKKITEVAAQELTNVSFTVTQEKGDKLGVYWEYRDETGKDLQQTRKDIIRLVGRYWKAPDENSDNKYTVKLTANVPDDGRTGEIVIEVKKPARLLTSGQSPTYRLSRDIDDNEINIDEICIEYGGRYGVPPQFIKGQIKQEAATWDFGSYTGFSPTYVFEPYTAQFWGWSEKPYNTGTWVVDKDRVEKPMGTGKNVPDHANVHYITYPQLPKTLWDIIYDHSQLVNNISGRDHTQYGIRRSDGTMNFYGYSIEEKYNYFLKTAALSSIFSSKSKTEIAREKMIVYLRDEWNGGAKNITAQTRLASSYGLLQFMFSTAVEKRHYPANDPQQGPEDLNVTKICLKYAMEYVKKLLRKKLSVTVEENGNWPKGFEKTFKTTVWGAWNTRSGYSSEVYAKTKLFTPQP